MATPASTPKGKEDNMNNPTFEKAKEAGTQTMNKAKDLGSQAVDKARDIGSQAMDKARDAASSVGGMVNQAAASVGKTAENLTTSAGSSLKNLGESLSQHTPHEGMLGSASQAVAHTLKDSGRYIEESGLGGIAEDLTQLIRRNPIPAVLVGVGLGFVIGRALRS